MAQFDSQLVFVQAGVTEGETPASVVGADAIGVSGLDVKPLDGSLVEREQVDPHGGRTVKSAMAMKFGTISFTTYGLARTPGTAPAEDALFLACGMTKAVVASTSVTYTQADRNSPIGFAHLTAYHGGQWYKFYGARGECEVTWAAGKLSEYKWNFTGLYVPPATGAVIAPTYPAASLPLIVDATNTGVFTLGPTGTPLAREFETLSLKLGNEIQRLERPGGTKRVTISKVAPTASAKIRYTSLGDFNPFELAANETEHALNLVHGPAGNRQTVDIPRFTYEAPPLEDSNNEIFHSMGLIISHPVNSPSNFTIKFS